MFTFAHVAERWPFQAASQALNVFVSYRPQEDAAICVFNDKSGANLKPIAFTKLGRNHHLPFRTELDIRFHVLHHSESKILVNL